MFLFLKNFFRYTASAQNSPCASMEEKRVFLSASRSTHLKQMRAKSTQNTSTLPPVRSKCSRWGEWEETWMYGNENTWYQRQPPDWPPSDPFQPKGADRKQKTDREKMEKRAPQEKEKYQPSYETTILTEVSWLLTCYRENDFADPALHVIKNLMFCFVSPTVQNQRHSLHNDINEQQIKLQLVCFLASLLLDDS